MTRDMAVGNPFKTVVYFSVPMLIGGLFQQFYSIADTIIVGKYVGSRSLAAIGETGSTVFIFLSFSLGFTNAFAIVMWQFFGAKYELMIKRTFLNSIYISLFVSFLLFIFGFFFANELMIHLRALSDIMEDSATYLEICVGLSFGQVFYNAGASILRALGNSKTPLYFLMFTTVLNVILDLIFVILLDMKVAWGAIGTVISQVVSSILCIIYIIKHFSILKLTKEDIVCYFNNLLTIIKIGLFMSIQSVFLSTGEMIISEVVNTFGTNVVASYSTGNRINQFAYF